MKKALACLSFVMMMGFVPLSVFAQTVVTINTSEGAIKVALDDKKAPKTVANFLTYVRDGFYNNTIFHRVIPGFMVQGGGFTADMSQKTTREPIQNEAANGLKNTKGTLAMARTNDPNSATAQFFINVADNHFLDKTSSNAGYAVFGKVTEGMDVVQKIVQKPTHKVGMHSDVPVQPVLIQSITIEK